MLKLIMKYLSIIATLYLLSLIFSAIYVSSIPALLIMGLVLFAVNLIIKPLLLLVTLPLNLLTLGFFSLIVNAWTIMIADHFVTGISMGGFLYSLLAAFIIVLFNQLFTGLTLKKCL